MFGFGKNNSKQQSDNSDYVSIDKHVLAELLAKQEIYLAGKSLNIKNANNSNDEAKLECLSVGERMREITNFFYSQLKEGNVTIIMSKEIPYPAEWEQIKKEQQKNEEN